MAAEIFTAISALRMVLDSETDADSPDNETTFAAIRVAIESLFLILLGTGVTGTVTGIAEEVLTDTTNFVDSAHLEHTLLMTSGSAKGNMYTIDSNTTSALTCTGDTMDSDGVAIADTYVILYDCKTSTGHTHDAKNAKSVDLADNSVDSEHYAADSIDAEHYAAGSVDQTAIGASAVGLGEVKTGTGTATALVAATNHVTVTMQDYCFFPNFCGTDIYFHMQNYHTTVTASYVAQCAVYNEHGGNQTYYMYYRYITATDEPFLYVMIDGDTGVAVGTWACTDPPPGYWGLDEKPQDFKPPLVSSAPPSNLQEIVLFKYPSGQYRAILEKAATDNRPLHELIGEDYDYNTDKKLFVTKNLVHI